jgi:hypothetical protein
MYKTERRKQAQQLIDAQALDTLFSASDLARLNAITGWSAAAAKKVRNQHHPKDTRTLAVSHDGDTFEVWSWNKAIDGYNHSANVIRALRSAIKEQTDEYAAAHPAICAACGSNEHASVDHKSRSFSKIAHDFLLKNPRVDCSVSNDGVGLGWKLTHKATLDAWLEFHKEHADYQILCRVCNSKKGAN